MKKKHLPSSSGPVVTSGTRARLIAAHAEAAKFYQEQLNTSPMQLMVENY